MTTKWGAFSKGCVNHDTTNEGTYYLDTGTKAHTGLDMDANEGDTVVAIADGVVVANGQAWGAEWRNVVVIEHTASSGEKFLAVYGHLFPDVAPKGAISAGQKVGRIQIPNVPYSGSHLHFGIKPGAWAGAAPDGSSASTVDAARNCTFNPLGSADPLTYLPARTPGSSAPPSRASLLKGGGFESGGWSFMPSTNSANYSSGQLDPSELARSGSKYMAFNTAVEGGGMYQDVAQSIGVGDTFCASAFVRSQIGGTASGGFVVWMIGGAYNENGQQPYSRLGTRSNWSPVSTRVTATTAHSAVRVQFYATPNGGTTQVDDVNLSRSLVQGGGFESGGWSFMPSTNSANYSSGQLDPSELARSGSKYMAFNTAVEGGGMYQDVAQSIGVGDTFCASAFVRSQIGGTASGGFVVWMIGGAYNENGQQPYSRLGTRSNWSPVSTCVTATTAHSAVRVQFYATPNGGTTQVDDVNLSRSLVQGGGFESGGWSFMPSTNSANYSSGQLDPSELARSGSKYMAFNTAVEGGGMYQDVAQSIGVGDTFCASAFVRSQIGGTASGGFVVWMIGGAYNENGQQPYSRLGTRSNWSPVSTCVTATTAHSAVRVQFYATPNGGTTQVDDVSSYLHASTHEIAGQQPPRISGVPKVGARLTASPGSWSPAASYAYQWLADGSTISGATSDTYVPTASTVGKRIAVKVTASKSGYRSASAVSAKTEVVKKGTITNSNPPSISGAVRVGSTLTVKVGAWSPSGLTYRYQWLRDGVTIRGATGKTYALTRASRGHRISVKVGASKVGFNGLSKTSPRTDVVR